MAIAVDLITTELARLRPEVDWVAGAAGYRARILATDVEVADILSAVAEDRRKLVTNHDALGYFAARYGFEIVATVIPGGSTLSEPSGSDLAHLVTAIRSSGVTAIFAENTSPSTLADALAAEIGSQVAVYELYTGALGPPGSGAATYLDMMTTNAHTIADALGGSR